MEADAAAVPAEDDLALRLFSPEGASDPCPVYHEMREERHLRSDFGIGAASLFLSRHDDVLWALRHPEVFSSAPGALEMGQSQPLIPLQVDPPHHTQYRRLLNPKFVPRRIAEMEPDVRVLVRELVDGFAGAGRCDVHEEFATPLPSTIFLRLMGLPQDDLATFLQWRDNTVRPDVDPGDLEAAAALREQTGKDITAYFEGAIDERAGRPADVDLMSELVNAEIDGRRLSREELLGIMHLLLLGGLDTVTATLDCMIVHLATHPETRRRIVEDPSMIPAAIEELLRRETPVTVVPRIVCQDATVNGLDVKAGEPVTLVLGGANTDSETFADAEDVDLDRDPNPHLAFGAGNHLCLGAHLARLELRVALEELHARIPDYRLADGQDLRFSPGIRQAESVIIEFDPRVT